MGHCFRQEFCIFRHFGSTFAISVPLRFLLVPFRFHFGSISLVPFWFQDWIQAGSRLDLAWIQPGSSLDPAWIWPGSRLDPAWIQPGSSLDPGWIRVRSGLAPGPNGIRQVNLGSQTTNLKQNFVRNPMGWIPWPKTAMKCKQNKETPLLQGLSKYLSNHPSK